MPLGDWRPAARALIADDRVWAVRGSRGEPRPPRRIDRYFSAAV